MSEQACISPPSTIYMDFKKHVCYPTFPNTLLPYCHEILPKPYAPFVKHIFATIWKTFPSFIIKHTCIIFASFRFFTLPSSSKLFIHLHIIQICSPLTAIAIIHNIFIISYWKLFFQTCSQNHYVSSVYHIRPPFHRQIITIYP